MIPTSIPTAAPMAAPIGARCRPFEPAAAETLGGRRVEVTALERMADNRRGVRMRRGDVLYREHEQAEGLYLVLCGAFKVLVRTAAGKERLADVAGAGDVLGSASIEKDCHAETVVAAGDGCVVALDGVEALSNDARRAVAASLARQLGRSREYADDMGLPTGARISRVLARLAARFGGEPAQGDVHLPFSLTHDDIALLAGCARVTVTRILGELKEAGAVHGNRGDYSVIPVRLEQETDRYVYDFL